jgi:hypothetical protein
MSQVYPFSPRKDSVEAGSEFVDFACAAMARVGWLIQYYASREYQFRHGDSRIMEFKRDDRCTGFGQRTAPTGRVSIEIAERANSAQWTPSGILAVNCPPLYTQGNPDLFEVFETRRLRDYLDRAKPEIDESPKAQPATVRKFYIPLPQAVRLALCVFEKGELKPLEAVTLPDLVVKQPAWTGTSPRTLASGVRLASSFKKQAGWKDEPWRMMQAHLAEAACCLEALSRGDEE